MSFLKGLLRLRTLPSTPPLPRNILEWCLGKINHFHRLRRSSSLIPQGQAEGAAACNANLQPFDVAGVVAVPIVHVNVDKLDGCKIDGDDGIIAIGDIPQQPPHIPLVVNDTDDDDAAGSDNDDNDDDNDDDDNGNNSSDEDNNNEPAAATDADVPEDNESDGDQRVRRSQRRGKSITKKYANYSLLMAAR